MLRPIKKQSLERLMKKNSSNKILISALTLLMPNKKNYLSRISIALLCIIPSVFIGVNSDTIRMTTVSIEKITSAMLALLGVVFTGYVLFQAMSSFELLARLLADSDENGKSKLEESNLYFIQVMMLQGISVWIGLFSAILLSAIPQEWSLFSSLSLNNVFAALMLWVYFFYNFVVIWELKSFVFNIFQIFNAHAVAKTIERVQTEDEK